MTLEIRDLTPLEMVKIELSLAEGGYDWALTRAKVMQLMKPVDKNIFWKLIQRSMSPAWTREMSDAWAVEIGIPDAQ